VLEEVIRGGCSRCSGLQQKSMLLLAQAPTFVGVTFECAAAVPASGG